MSYIKSSDELVTPVAWGISFLSTSQQQCVLTRVAGPGELCQLPWQSPGAVGAERSWPAFTGGNVVGETQPSHLQFPTCQSWC